METVKAPYAAQAQFIAENEAFMQQHNLTEDQLIDIVLYDPYDLASVSYAEMEQFLNRMRMDYGIRERIMPIPVIYDGQNSKNIPLPPDAYIKNIFVILHGGSLYGSPNLLTRAEPTLSCKKNRCTADPQKSIESWSSVVTTWALNNNRARLPNLNVIILACKLLGDKGGEPLADFIKPQELQEDYFQLVHSQTTESKGVTQPKFWVYMNQTTGMPPQEYAQVLKNKDFGFGGFLSDFIQAYFQAPLVDAVFKKAQKNWNKGYLFFLSPETLGNMDHLNMVQLDAGETIIEYSSDPKFQTEPAESAIKIPFIKADFSAIVRHKVQIQRVEFMNYSYKYFGAKRKKFRHGIYFTYDIREIVQSSEIFDAGMGQ